MQNVGIRTDRNVLAKLKEDRALAPVTLVRAGGYEDGLESLEARVRNCVAIGEECLHEGKLSWVVARDPSVIDSDAKRSQWSRFLSYDVNLGPVAGGDGALEDIDRDQDAEVSSARQNGPERDV
jgi:hypothetical protein